MHTVNPTVAAITLIIISACEKIMANNPNSITIKNITALVYGKFGFIIIKSPIFFDIDIISTIHIVFIFCPERGIFCPKGVMMMLQDKKTCFQDKNVQCYLNKGILNTW